MHGHVQGMHGQVHGHVHGTVLFTRIHGGCTFLDCVSVHSFIFGLKNTFGHTCKLAGQDHTTLLGCVGLATRAAQSVYYQNYGTAVRTLKYICI